MQKGAVHVRMSILNRATDLRLETLILNHVANHRGLGDYLAVAIGSGLTAPGW